MGWRVSSLEPAKDSPFNFAGCAVRRRGGPTAPRPTDGVTSRLLAARGSSTMDSSAHTERPTWRDRAAQARAQAEELRTLRALALRFGVDADQADDVAQEAALALHRTSSVLERRALVWGVAKHTAARHLRTNMLRRQVFEEAAPLLRASPAPAAEDMAIAHGPRAMLEQAIEEMRRTAPRLFEVLSLHLEGLTMPEIAAALLVPYGTAETRFQRARAVLRETVRRWAAKDASRAQLAQLTKGAPKRWS